MAFKIPDFEAIRDDMLRDLVALDPIADIEKDSDYYVRASSIASCASGIYAYQSWIVRQIFPNTADTEFLELHASLRHIFRKSATPSTATASVTGNAGVTVPANREIRASDGLIFKTNKAITLDNHRTASVRITCTSPGTAGNSAAAQTGQLIVAIPGVTTITLSQAVGGTEQETDASLLARLLNHLRMPPAGGNKNDYQQWALSVPGVARAYVYPLRRGLGTVDIAILADDGLPSATVIQSAQSYIDEVRPTTAKNALVLAPSLRCVNLTMQVRSIKPLAVITEKIKSAIADFFDELEPNATLYRSQLEAVISDIDGIIDRNLIRPADNVKPKSGAIEWLRVGTIEVESL